MTYSLKMCVLQSLMIFSSFTLAACTQHQNPLLNTITIQKLKAYYSFALDNQTEICPEYYAGLHDEKITSTTKTVCDAQMQSDYSFLSRNRQDILNGASISDLRDPNLWKMYLETNG